jgi:bifunctional non-homologous end joining protein LigD
MEPSLPPPRLPMLATLGRPPVASGWAWEMKWDGLRGICRVAGDRMALDSRNGRSLLGYHPELTDLPAALAGRAVTLDGELVVFDAQGRPSFELLQQRLRPRPSRALVERLPVAYLVFDLLFLDGGLTTRLPYLQRRALLADLALAHGHVQVPPSWTDLDGPAVAQAAWERGLEGVVAKRAQSIYHPARRSRDWIKCPFRLTTEVVVGGWVPGHGRRTGLLGAVLVGAHDDRGDLVYLGMVGTGFSRPALRELGARLADLTQPVSPFADAVPGPDARDARWVRPMLVGDVEYRQLTSDRRLRHPSWRGVRVDRDAEEVVLPAVGSPQPWISLT